MKKFICLGLPLFLFAYLLSSCSKDKDADPGPVTTDTLYYKLHRVENLYTEVDDASPTSAQPTIYFSLQSAKQVPLDYAKTNRWDISFGGLYSSFMGGNNGVNGTNVGYGGPGKGGITILQAAFDAVTDVPADGQFKTGSQVVGTDDAGDYGEGTGWYLYDFSGTKVSDGTYEKQHIAYALADTLTLVNGSKIKPRTVIIKTANGDYAKIKMISCYKDLFTVSSWYRSAPKMYFTFEYVIVPAGSTKFEIK